MTDDLDYGEMCDRRLLAYQLIAVYARGYKQAVDAQDEDWERNMGIELETALRLARHWEAQISTVAA